MNTKPFASEAQLVRSGRRVLKTALAQLDEPVKARYDVRGPGVVPDLVLFTKRSETVSYVVTVEFKLRNWQRALAQAFKHRNFGNEAYVVLDDAHAASALKNLSRFEEANVGLVSVARYETVHFWHFPVPSGGRVRGCVKSEATYLSVGYQSTSPGGSPGKGASPHGKG